MQAGIGLRKAAAAIALTMSIPLTVAANAQRGRGVLIAADTAHLHYVSASGSLLFEVGKATGTLPGSMEVHLLVGATFSGSFTIHVHGGSIHGHGSALPKGSGVYESFAGHITVTGGTGRYRHAHGTGKLYGTFNRRTYALLMQTAGTLRY